MISYPGEEKGVSIDFIVTPTRTIKVQSPHPGPSGIDWSRLDTSVMAAMRPLRELASLRWIARWKETPDYCAWFYRKSHTSICTSWVGASPRGGGAKKLSPLPFSSFSL